MSDSLIWFIAAVLILTGEMMIPGVFLLFFAFGAFAVSLINLFIDLPLFADLSIFLSVSVISLILLRKKFKSTFFGRLGISKSQEQFLGKKAIVKNIDGEKIRVELNGTLWNATTEDNLEIGEEVMIISRKSLIFKVAKNLDDYELDNLEDEISKLDN
jgi:inner membrane protein